MTTENTSKINNIYQDILSSARNGLNINLYESELFDCLSGKDPRQEIEEIVALLSLSSVIQFFRQLRNSVVSKEYLATDTHLNDSDEKDFLNELSCSPQSKGFASGLRIRLFTLASDIDIIFEAKDFIGLMKDEIKNITEDQIKDYFHHSGRGLLCSKEKSNPMSSPKSEVSEGFLNILPTESKELYIRHSYKHKARRKQIAHESLVNKNAEIGAFIQDKETVKSLSPFMNYQHSEDGLQIISDTWLEGLLHGQVESLIMGCLDCRGEKGKILSEIVNYYNLAYPLRLAYPKDNTLEKLDILNEKFPNFYEVTKYIKEHIAYLNMRKKPVKIPNILLDGHPGIGKSEYAFQLSLLLNSPCSVIPMSSLSTAAELVGLSSVWAGGQIGLLTQKLSEGCVANPIFLLDEIDKSATSGGNSVSPNLALLSLTENTTAKRFFNPFLKTYVDMSHINWIATSNNSNSINNALLTRFKLFKVPSPNRSEFTLVVNNIYAELLTKEKLSTEFEITLSDEIINELYKSGLRDVKEKLMRAIMNAFSNPFSVNGKKSITLSMINITDKKRSNL
jgi:ATP-dependent Lon protease